jgi:NTE family protein
VNNSASETALVLSGGGIRGMAHIGFIRALQEHGLTVDRVAGSSAGALVGALFLKRPPYLDIIISALTSPD